MNVRTKKTERQTSLQEILKEDPFVTDEELSEKLEVSIQTIRLDRMELGIPELRERVKNVAENNYAKIRAIAGKEFVGELIDFVPGKSAISILDTSKNMVFE